MTQKEQAMFQEAQEYLIGGCVASGRFNPVYGQPMYLSRADGPRLYDLDGNGYIDYHCSAGPILFGYNNPRLKKAANEAMDMGAFMFFDSQEMIDLAKEYRKIFPSAEIMRLVNSGSEATLHALRIARAYTNRKLVIRCDGHFHGMHEMIWYNHNKVGEVDEIGEVKTMPDGEYVPEEFASMVKVAPFNDYEAMERIVDRYKGQVAAIIMEPISYNCGCMPGRKEYLEKIRELCTREGIVLIFDEVICPFRLRPGSAQAYYGVTPDLTTIAKAIGGGYPLAAVVGKREVMSMVGPKGKAGVSGTYSGSILGVKVGLECVKMIQEDGFYDKIEELGNALYGGLNDLMQKHGICGHVRGIGARFGIYFGLDNPEDDYDFRKIVAKYDADAGAEFIGKMLEQGVYLHTYGKSPYPNHNGFGITHTMDDINYTLEAADKALKSMR